jgi:hypothetical protein
VIHEPLEPATKALARDVARPYIHQIDELLAGRVTAGAFAWAYEQAWLAQQGDVPGVAYRALNELFVVATAWNPELAAAGDDDHSGPVELIAAARACRGQLIAALA